ncbi:uncharacterized protein LY89DRAFT_122906 [Mollisia scopiformis]|uniref:Transcriptional regulator n=1 Tax=Mollisia scopiformis TaxID=149040 RepID=A0A194X3Q8_MOLSC|nr:uncharacterized protein LY89DRAFT_122906 [Mollisia scopiformis]KUJ14825.1 hypothetical protein LY89DRAFT_122906 [Mollisia scopiformis]
MAPSEKMIVAELRSAILSTFNGPDRTLLTVKKIRAKVEEDLNLPNDFFSQGAWKEKSKTLIRTYAQELMDGEEAAGGATSSPVKAKPESTPQPTPKKITPLRKGTKRASQEKQERPKKRQKKEETPISDEEIDEPTEEESEEAEESEFGDSEDSDDKGRKKSKAKGPKCASKSRAKVDSDSGEDDESEDSLPDSLVDSDDSDAPKKKTKPKSKPAAKPTPKRQVKTKPKAKHVSEDEEDEPEEPPKTATKDIVDSEEEPEETDTALAPKKEEHKSQFMKAPSAESSELTPVPKDADLSDSEMSVVLDEEPKPKRKRRSKVEMADPSSRAPKPAKAPKEPKAAKPAKTKAKAPPAGKDLTEDEQQIKTYQSQLKKCGINKIWQFELKQYGDDNKAKIRHLQGVLKDIGMTGRFSEARAREIKEMRELQADLEAVKEGEKSWGLDSGRRASRGGSKKKSLKEDSDEDDEGGDAGDDDDEDEKKASNSRSSSEQPAARKPRARAALAFLEDEDSDE